jgi:hypothetical protein
MRQRVRAGPREAENDRVRAFQRPFSFGKTVQPVQGGEICYSAASLTDLPTATGQAAHNSESAETKSSICASVC